MAYDDNSGTGGGSLLLSVPLFAAGLYTLLNHGQVHGAIHANITPEAFGSMVAWAVWGLEISIVAGIIVFFALVATMLTAQA